MHFFKNEIYDNDYLFNQLDLKRIFVEKVMLSECKSYTLAFKWVPERKDNSSYVLEIKGKVKYHNNDKCEALTRGFKNFVEDNDINKLKSVAIYYPKTVLTRTLKKEITYKLCAHIQFHN